MPDINNFFTSWSDALNSATISALLIAQPLINEVDLDQKTNFASDDLLTALTAGLAFFGAPEVSESISVAANIASGLLWKGLQQAPGVAKARWPSGTSDTKSIQLANIDTELTEAGKNYTTWVEQALATVMEDVPSFIAFAQNGSFSGSDQISLPDDASSLGLALNTYILSTAMSANQFRAAPITSVTRLDIESNVPGSGGSDCSFGNSSICANADHSINVFYSDTAERAYSFPISYGAPDLNPFTLLNDIVSKNWSTLELLFDGALNCTLAGGYGQPLNFLIGDELCFSCMSQLQMRGCGDPCPVELVNETSPFTTCGLC